MAEKEDFGGDHIAAVTGGTSFSQLLFADDHHDVDKNHIFNYSAAFAIENPPKMLCFSNKEGPVFTEPSKTPQRSGVTCSDSSSASSGDNSSRKVPVPKSNSKLKRRNGSDQEADAIRVAPASIQRPSKKIKADTPSSAGHAKRKEKLGERITALQQLVSPFGKTDTASVLHEATGYIKFLHEQVQVLCSPYLQHLPSLSATQGGRGSGEVEAKTEDLRSRGLCLIPVDCSLHLADCTVADFWSPSMGKKL